MDEKARLRRQMKAVRQAVAIDARADKSRRIHQRLLALESFGSAECFFVYVSFRSEVQTHELICDLLARGKTVTVPKIVTSPRMQAVRITKWADLRPGKYGILEPANAPLYEGPPDICIAPGLAFSRQGDRLGYGKGHYDHFLVSRAETLVVGLAFDCQIVDHIPTEPTDQAMNIIVTEQRLIRPRS